MTTTIETKKRVKTVFGTHEIAHLWANQSVEKARNPGNNLFFEGTKIYSYGYHFVIAQIYTLPSGERVALFSSRDWSRTTSKHKSYARCAWDGASITLDYKHFPRPENFTQEKLEDLQALAAQELVDNADYTRQARNAAARRARAAKKENALAMVEKIAQWKAGTRASLSYEYTGETLLRRTSDGQIETSRGARVPLAIGQRAYALFLRGELQAGHDLGHYKVDTVGADTVKIGCHVLSKDVFTEFFTSLPA